MNDINQREQRFKKGFSDEEIKSFLDMINRFIGNLEDKND